MMMGMADQTVGMSLAPGWSSRMCMNTSNSVMAAGRGGGVEPGGAMQSSVCERM